MKSKVYTCAFPIRPCRMLMMSLQAIRFTWWNSNVKFVSMFHGFTFGSAQNNKQILTSIAYPSSKLGFVFGRRNPVAHRRLTGRTTGQILHCSSKHMHIMWMVFFMANDSLFFLDLLFHFSIVPITWVWFRAVAGSITAMPGPCAKGTLRTCRAGIGERFERQLVYTQYNI